tara:strand:+ start:447 stop:647 length:201 start_codon:yes stop_codon:yes gene_type:complete
MKMSEEYILIIFPEVQEYMTEKWFRQECYLCQAFEDQEHIDSAYFVPKDRVKEYNDNLKGDKNDNV